MPTVLQLSDTHLTSDGRGCYDRDPAGHLLDVVDAWSAAGRQADLVLISGDITDDGSDEGCQAVAEIVAGIGVPVFAIPGNHDAEAAVSNVFGAAAQIELDGWRVLGVSSVIPGEIEGAIVPAEVLARLDALDARPTVIALHHPPRSPSSHAWFLLGGSDELLDGLAARPHVRAVVSGHLHQPFEERLDGLALLGAPSTLYGIRHLGEAFELDPTIPIGARILDLRPDGDVVTELLVTAPTPRP
jgi:3',5'-cyclic-AMP phosphodiesterase